MDVKDLQAPLDPTLEYFDATPSMEQILEKVTELHAVIELQQSINSKLIGNMRTLHDRVEQLEQAQAKVSPLILPERMRN